MTAAELRALLEKATKGDWAISRYCATTITGPNFSVANCGIHNDNQRDPDELATELQANAALIVALRNNAERFAELLAAEESPYRWSWSDQAKAYVYTLESEYVGQVWQFSGPDWWWCLKNADRTGTAKTLELARAAVEDAVRAGR